MISDAAPIENLCFISPNYSYATIVRAITRRPGSTTKDTKFTKEPSQGSPSDWFLVGDFE
jgi:hypothetical protein